MDYRTEPLLVQPKFSRTLMLWLMVVHLSAFLVLWQLPLSLSLKLTLALLQLVYSIWQVRQHLLRNTRWAIREIQLDADGIWWLITYNGSKLHGSLLADSFVKPWLLLLNFKTDSPFFYRSVILPPDSIDPDVARRLRIHLQLFEKSEPKGMLP